MSNSKTNDFIEKAKLVHGDRYDYSKVNYINSYTAVIIICRLHSEFPQTPNSHISQQSNCKKCTIEKSYLTQDEFLERANKLHNYKYDYSKTVYVHSHNYIKIICPIHKSFKQLSSEHLKGRGCNLCSKSVQTSNKEEFIEKANRAHNNSYNYEEVIYINNATKVKIICNKHSAFFQRPQNHLYSGCPECSLEKKRLSTDEFIEKANKIHKNKYDYSLSEYKTSKTYVKIICNKHGIFRQKSTTHLAGHGCSACSTSVSKKENEWLDYLNIAKEYRQFKLKINGRRFRFDAFDPTTNTIYEFYGDYWHGNPKVFKEGINLSNKKPYKQLYKDTKTREKLLKKAGYNIISIWESDFDKLQNKKDK